MYLQNKYTVYYYNIVTRAKSRVLLQEHYVEKHHIIPKSLGGDHNSSKLVKLTAREHLICHLLLIRMTTGNDKHKMIYAAWRMMFASKKHNRVKPTARIYESIRIEMAKIASVRGKGRRHSEESKKKISNSKLGKSRNITPEWRARIAASQTGIKKVPCSEQTKKKISEALTGVKREPMSAESKAKLSASKIGKKIIIDPVTGKRVYQALA